METEQDRPKPASESSAAKEDKSRPNRLGLVVGGGLIAVVAFCLGMAFGDGQVMLGGPGFGKQGSALPANLDYSSVEKVYDVLRQEYDGKLDQNKLLAGMKQGLAEATGDPYTEYFTSEQYKKFDEQLNGAGFSGIGAELGLDKDKNLIVVAPISGTPAYNAGIKPKDIITAIDGKDTTGISIEEAVSKVRGKKGTKVKLNIVRNRTGAIELEITRDDIRVPSVDSKMLDDGTTGYLRISTFGNDTGRLATEKATELKSQGAKSIVLDLRGDPGGVVDSAIEVASLWLPKGKLIMQEKRDNTVIKTYTSNGSEVLTGIPTAVLIDGGSASASEIVAGALRDNNAAKLFGEKSYGKGVVQGVEPLNDGSQLKVTIARWYRPNGQNIDKKGIEPDQKIVRDEAAFDAGKDNQLEAAQAAVKN